MKIETLTEAELSDLASKQATISLAQESEYQRQNSEAFLSSEASRCVSDQLEELESAGRFGVIDRYLGMTDKERKRFTSGESLESVLFGKAAE
jgi:hypothetical protein